MHWSCRHYKCTELEHNRHSSIGTEWNLHTEFWDSPSPFSLLGTWNSWQLASQTETVSFWETDVARRKPQRCWQLTHASAKHLGPNTSSLNWDHQSTNSAFWEKSIQSTFQCFSLKYEWTGTFLVVQWLRLCPSTAGGTGLTPGQGTKVLQATQSGQ